MKGQILVVDDEPAVRLSIERALLRRGYDVITVAGVEEAYEALAEHAVQVILLDVRLPPVGGEAFFYAMIRRWPELGDRVVFMSGHPHHLDEDWPEPLRRCAFLLKPFPLEALYRTVETVIARQQFPDQRAQNGH